MTGPIPVPKAHLEALKQIDKLPDLFSCAQAAIDTPEFPARRIAIAIYKMLYDTYSADTHGDIRHVLGAVWFDEANFLEHVVDDAIDVSVILLAAVSLQLGFRADVEKFVSENELWNPFHASAKCVSVTSLRPPSRGQRGPTPRSFAANPGSVA